jgi:hypothetical protein
MSDNVLNIKEGITYIATIKASDRIDGDPNDQIFKCKVLNIEKFIAKVQITEEGYTKVKEAKMRYNVKRGRWETLPLNVPVTLKEDLSQYATEDVTPTWASLIPYLLENKDNPSCREQIYRLAMIADNAYKRQQEFKDHYVLVLTKREHEHVYISLNRRINRLLEKNRWESSPLIEEVKKLKAEIVDMTPYSVN